MEKFVLFYSNYCGFSKQVVSEINKKNIRSMFVFICVDQNKYSLPDFVTHVPIIVSPSPKSRKIYAEDEIMVLLESMYAKIRDSDDIQPFLTGFGCKASFGDPFSFIDGDDSAMDAAIPKKFGVLETDNDFHINAPDEGAQKKSRFNEDVFETFKAQRDMDEQILKPQRI
jgi:hypothetical protein